VKLRSRVALWCALAAPVSLFASSLSPAAAQDAVGDLPASNAQTPTPEDAARAGVLVREAIVLAENNLSARSAVVRGAAALLPRLESSQRDDLTMRWMRLLNAQTSRGVLPRSARLDAYESFFEVAARVQSEGDFAHRMALAVPDDAARAGALLQLSRASENTNYARSLEYSQLAQTAARQESNKTERARALTFVAYRMAVQNTQDTAAALEEATEAARALNVPRERDYLLAEIVGASANFDLPMARRIAGSISDETLRGLATARTNIAEASQTTLTVATTERVSSLAKAAARYDVRAIPILIQLPAQADVLQALSDALPPIYPTARPAISPQLLERMWTYSTTATDTGASRDELQSRLARLMVLHDLWRGRDWGKQLAWKGGRVQVGAFLKDVLQSRRSQVRAMPLQDVAKRNVDAAIRQARGLSNPASRAEALLLIAGQLLG
jgi:hypothetical protein